MRLGRASVPTAPVGISPTFSREVPPGEEGRTHTVILGISRKASAGWKERVVGKRNRIFVFLWMAASMLGAGAAAAQGLSGDVAVGQTWLNEGGSLSSFRTQYNRGEGTFLENLLLEWRPAEETPVRFSLKAWSLGDPEPDHHARLLFAPTDSWRFRLGFDERASFFALADPPEDHRADRWTISRWNASIAYDGWSAARITLGLRHTRREGQVDRVLYGLNELYPMRVDLDESYREVSLRVETKSLPVRLFFEQSLGTYDRENRWRALSGKNLAGDDPDLLSRLETNREEEIDVPTSRLGAFYRNGRWDLAGTFLYSQSDLDASGSTWRTFDLAGGSSGQVAYLDELVGAASQDTLAGDVRAAYRLTGSWLLRFQSSYRKSQSDSDLLGRSLLRIGSPGIPGLLFSVPADERGFFDVTDRSAGLEAAYEGARFGAWGGVFGGSRGVDWRRTTDGRAFSSDRDSTGYRLGASWRAGRRLSLSGEWERGTFEQYVLRVDPETVDRLTLRMRSDLDRGWSVSLHGRFERSDNPASESALDHTSDAYGGSVAWDHPGGRGGVALDVDRARLRTHTDILLPDRTASLSEYDMGLWTWAIRGYFAVKRLTFDGSLVRVKDSGETWPTASWIGDARATLQGPKGTRLSLFVQRRDYDEARSALDDFQVTRYGVVFGWRF
jgi:hypothetical protein